MQINELSRIKAKVLKEFLEFSKPQMMKYSEIRNPIFVNFKHEIHFPSFEAFFEV